MIKTRTLLIILVPAILIASFALFVRIIQYEPLLPKIDKETADQNQDGLITIPIYPEDPMLGNKKAPKTIIVFEDFGCENCKEQFSVISQLLTKHPDAIKIIWKGLPVARFPYPSDLAHEYAYCLNKQEEFENFAKFAFTNSHQLKKEILDMIVKEMDVSAKKLNECLETGEAKNHIERTKQIGRLLNIQAVPAVFLNNKQINPPATVEGWEAMVGI